MLRVSVSQGDEKDNYLIDVFFLHLDWWKKEELAHFSFNFIFKIGVNDIAWQWSPFIQFLSYTIGINILPDNICSSYLTSLQEPKWDTNVYKPHLVKNQSEDSKTNFNYIHPWHWLCCNIINLSRNLRKQGYLFFTNQACFLS